MSPRNQQHTKPAAVAAAARMASVASIEIAAAVGMAVKRTEAGGRITTLRERLVVAASANGDPKNGSYGSQPINFGVLSSQPPRKLEFGPGAGEGGFKEAKDVGLVE